MKEFCIRVLVILVCIMLMVSISQVAFSSTLPVIDYSALFDKAKNTDTSESERIAYDLVCAYDNDPNGLIKALSKQAPNEIERIARLLVYGKSYGDLNTFKTHVKSISSKAISDKENVVIDLVLDAIEQRQRFDRVPIIQDPPSAPPPFDAETILRFIEINEELGNVDEAFFHVIANAFRLDPLFLLRLFPIDPKTP